MIPLPASLPPDACPTWPRRVFSAVLLTLFALSIYGAANHLADWRGVTRCHAMPWELEIPRVNWTVVPYWGIDLMLAASPLLTRRIDEWHLLLRRLFWAFSISCAIFMLYPMRCGYVRTVPDDWTAPLFALLHTTDLPYNQAPSLHVSEAILIAPVYLARVRLTAGKVLLAAFIATGCVATVLTHQHHLIDLVTGAALGFLLLRVIRPGQRFSASAAVSPDESPPPT